MNRPGTLNFGRPLPRVASQHLDAAGNRHGHRGGREEGERQARQPGREHVVHPQAEAEHAGADQRQHDQPVADEARLGDRRHHHRDQTGRRQEDDVDLGVAEQPEQVLPEERVAAPFRQEERPVQRALELE
jgi:hypothetical protein